MTPEEYRLAALRTENTPTFINHARRIFDPNSAVHADHDRMLSRLMHAILGMITELGELCDPVKKHLIYGAELDLKNLAEESGDQAWYSNLALDAIDAKLEDIWTRNIAKLRARYPNKFTEEKALNRDLDAEHKALHAQEPLKREATAFLSDAQIVELDERIKAVVSEVRLRPSDQQGMVEAVRTLRWMFINLQRKREQDADKLRGPTIARVQLERIATALGTNPRSDELSDLIAEHCLNEIAALKAQRKQFSEGLQELHAKIRMFSESLEG